MTFHILSEKPGAFQRINDDDDDDDDDDNNDVVESF